MEKCLSEQHKKNISLGVRKRYENGLKPSRGMLGKNHSKNTKKKIGLKNSGTKGYIPWNKDKKGIYSDETLKKMSESKKGIKPWNYLDGRSKNPEPRKTVKGKLFSHIVWCSQKGNHPYVPKGFVIHHMDCNPKNNNPNNLQLMPDRIHRSLHNQISLRGLGR